MNAGKRGGASSSLLDADQAAKAQLFWHRPAERPIHPFQF